MRCSGARDGARRAIGAGLWLCGCLLLAAPAVGGAQTPAQVDATSHATSQRAPAPEDLTRAREFERQGLQAFDNGQYRQAEALLSQAIALNGAPTLYVARARARSAMGRLIAAASDLYTVNQLPVAADEPAVFAEARAAAKRDLPVLEARFGYLTVRLVGGSGQVTVGELPWPAAALGKPWAIDPGTYQVVAKATAGAAHSKQITLGEGQIVEVTFDLTEQHLPPPRTPQAPPPPPSAAAAASGARPDVVLETKDGGPGFSHASAAVEGGASHTAAFVVGTITVAVTVAAVITGLSYLGKRSAFNDVNNSNQPRKVKEDARSQAQLLRVAATVLTGASILGTGVTVYLILAADEPEPAPAATGLRFPGLRFQGVF